MHPGSGTVTLSWSSVEGGTYRVEASDTPASNSWVTVSAAVTATPNATRTTNTEAGAALIHARRFYRVSRTSLAPYDP
ncbi:MAG: hypothetical protein RJA22_3385 [Verrucomicrobiota bacterium]